MRLLIVSDAWAPQVNGVVRTLTQVSERLRVRGNEVMVVGPSGWTAACPTYPEIRLSLRPAAELERVFRDYSPTAVHIATEGPLGWAARRLCRSYRWPFTTSFHTRFPEYLKARFHVPRRWTYRFLREFHRRSECILAPTPSVVRDLHAIGLTQAVVWGRGVDTVSFSPNQARPLALPRPIQLYVGRLAIEKNVDAFLRSTAAGTKIVVGDGPEAGRLKSQYRDAHFLGTRFGDELAQLYASADVFVFPSQTDTFGLVMLEALACGTPVAALPSPAAFDVLGNAPVAAIDSRLEVAIERALGLSRTAARNFALRHSWDQCVEIMARHLAPIDVDRDSKALLHESQRFDLNRAGITLNPFAF